MAGIECLARAVQGHGGMIIIDSGGKAKSFITNRMIHGWVEKNGEVNCGFNVPCRIGLVYNALYSSSIIPS